MGSVVARGELVDELVVRQRLVNGVVSREIFGGWIDG